MTVASVLPPSELQRRGEGASRAQDHDRRPGRLSYHETAWPAIPVRADRPPRSRGSPPGRTDASRVPQQAGSCLRVYYYPAVPLALTIRTGALDGDADERAPVGR